jgi:hypothetical protein
MPSAFVVDRKLEHQPKNAPQIVASVDATFLSALRDHRPDVARLEISNAMVAVVLGSRRRR